MDKGRCLSIAFWVLITTCTARAEYRVFSLAITDTQTGETRKVVSNLDDIQYPTYHSLLPREKIVIEDSWMCWRRSDNFQSYCRNPRAPAAED